jgi:hypothetical protein
MSSQARVLPEDLKGTSTNEERGAGKDIASAIDAAEEDQERCSTVEEIDVSIESYCADPSVYTIAVFSSGVKPSRWFAWTSSVILQAVVPWIVNKMKWPAIKNQYALDDDEEFFPCPNEADWGVKLTCAVVSWYLSSTLVSALKRTYAMAVIHYSMKNNVSIICAVLLSLSCVSTITTTYFLFLSDPQVASILTNAVAVNFIPDADVSFGGMLADCAPRKRIARFSKLWPESEERDRMVRILELPFGERLKKIPLLFLTSLVLDFFKVFVCMAPVLTTVCI